MTTSPSAPDHRDAGFTDTAYDAMEDPAYLRFMQEMFDEYEAIQEGRATALARCPIDDSLQGVTRTFVSKGFDPTECLELRCGHIVL